MKELAGEDGIIIIGFWNGNKFGEALQYFYHKHPELCGTMKGATIDIDERHLDTKEGYHTHWTTPEEARKVTAVAAVAAAVDTALLLLVVVMVIFDPFCSP